MCHPWRRGPPSWLPRWVIVYRETKRVKSGSPGSNRRNLSLESTFARKATWESPWVTACDSGAQNVRSCWEPRTFRLRNDSEAAPGQGVSETLCRLGESDAGLRSGSRGIACGSGTRNEQSVPVAAWGAGKPRRSSLAGCPVIQCLASVSDLPEFSQEHETDK